MAMAMLSYTALFCSSLVVVEQTLHTRHRPPPGQPHLEVPARLSRLPESTCRLVSLATLQLSGNVLVELPSALGCLHAHLTSLEVSDNRLSALPDSLCDLTRLVALRASENRLVALPAAIGRLHAALTTLVEVKQYCEAEPLMAIWRQHTADILLRGALLRCAPQLGEVLAQP